MRFPLRIWALVSLVIQAKAVFSRQGSKAHAANAVSSGAASAERTVLRRSKFDPFGAFGGSDSDVSKFGPGNCLSTYRNADGHCTIETKCKNQDISQYAVKFICIDAGGQQVRHVFTKGSFDSEEQFDTLIECKKCVAEKEEKVERIQDGASANAADIDSLPSSAGGIDYIPPRKDGTVPGKYKQGTPYYGKDGARTRAASQEPKVDEGDELNNAGLDALKQQVKSLEAAMMTTSNVLEKLNSKVFGDNAQQQAAAPAAAPEPQPKALIHHATHRMHHEQKPDEAKESLRVQVEAAHAVKEHQRQLQAEAEGREEPTQPREAVKILARRAAAAPPSSLSSGMRSTEERDDQAPAALPARSQMVLSDSSEKDKDESVEEDDDADSD